jgi:hypothetical protein
MASPIFTKRNRPKYPPMMAAATIHIFCAWMRIIFDVCNEDEEMDNSARGEQNAKIIVNGGRKRE